MKVLLIDDCASECKASFLLDFKAEMFFAEDERAAEAILKTVSVDIILMDGYLGGGVNGCDIVKRFRASGITTKIVMFSGDEKRNNEGLAAGANGKWNKDGLGEEDWREKLFQALIKP